VAVPRIGIRASGRLGERKGNKKIFTTIKEVFDVLGELFTEEKGGGILTAAK